jgi:FAD/FMN-containing dehydrogenase
MLASNLKKTGRFNAQPAAGPVSLDPTNVNYLRRSLSPESRLPQPIRPRGAGAAATDCNWTESGTTLNMAGLDRIINIDNYNHTVTVQAGVRLATLVGALKEHGLELGGGYDLGMRTVGGAISAPCFGPTIGNAGGYLSSYVTGLKVIRADGRLMRIDSGQSNLLAAFRMSFGMLGVISEATLRVRPIRTFSASHRRVSIDKFATLIDALANGEVGLKFYLMPHRDRVYLDLRRYEASPGHALAAPWKLKDWGESTVLPHIFKSLNRVVPIPSVRYRLMDSISEATQGLLNSRLVANGTNASTPSASRRCYYSTWCFPAANFSVVARAYREFCESTYAQTRYRCDLPAVGYRLCHDSTALLSPSYDEPMIALTTASTQTRGWDNFVIDLAEFAEHWGGTPLISQSRAVRAEHVIQSYNRRLDFFRRLRRQLDPDGRFLNPFLAQFCK